MTGLMVTGFFVLLFSWGFYRTSRPYYPFYKNDLNYPCVVYSWHWVNHGSGFGSLESQHLLCHIHKNSTSIVKKDCIKRPGDVLRVVYPSDLHKHPDVYRIPELKDTKIQRTVDPLVKDG